MSAGRGEMVGVGRAALRPGFAVVEVAVLGGHAASGEDAGRVAGVDLSFDRCGGSSSGGAGGYGLSVVGDHIGSLGVVLVCGYLAGDVGYDRAHPGQFAGLVV